MSQVDNVHTINLGKVLLSQRQHRAVRAINMIREYTIRHKGAVSVKIDEKLAQQIWARGVRRPPRKVTVEFVEDGDVVLVAPYESVDVAEPQTAEPDTAKIGGSGAGAGTVTTAAALAEPETKEDVTEAAAVQEPAGQEEVAAAPEEPEMEAAEIEIAPEPESEDVDNDAAEAAAVQEPAGQEETAEDTESNDDDSTADPAAAVPEESPEVEPSGGAESQTSPDQDETGK